MKKRMCILFMVLVGLLLGTLNTCGGQRDELTPSQQYFLADLDYMLYVLENNFALFDVVERERGMDIHGMAGRVRADVLANPDMTANEFFDALHEHFLPLSTVAHFQFVSGRRYENIINNINAWERSVVLNHSVYRLRKPHVTAFYTERLHYLNTQFEGLDLETQLRMESNNALKSFGIHFADRLSTPDTRTLSNALRLAVAESDIDTLIPLLVPAMDEVNNLPNVITQVLEEGRIAYLSVGTFMRFPAIDDAGMILDFYEEIQDFDHLIIDLRRNMGGAVSYFTNYIMRPIIKDPFYVDGFIFGKNSGYSMRYVRNIQMGFVDDVSGIRTTAINNFQPVTDIFERYDLPAFYVSDISRLEYGTRIRYGPVHPLSVIQSVPPFPPFAGEIWMLTGEGMVSAAMLSAWIAQDAGFGTLVGTVTGGHYGGPRTFVVLPNTGIVFTLDLFYVTDRHGRPLEAGIIPHYFNHEGMDALDTVLAMISTRG